MQTVKYVYGGSATRKLSVSGRTSVIISGDNGTTRFIFKFPDVYKDWTKYIEWSFNAPTGNVITNPRYQIFDDVYDVTYDITAPNAGKTISFVVILTNTATEEQETSLPSPVYITRGLTLPTDATTLANTDIITQLSNRAFTSAQFDVEHDAYTDKDQPTITFNSLPNSTNTSVKLVLEGVPYVGSDGFIDSSFLPEEKDYNGVVESVTNETTAREEADTALNTAIVELKQVVADNKSAIETSLATEISERRSADETLQSSIDALTASTTENLNTAIVELKQAIADNASGISTLSTNLDKEISNRKEANAVHNERIQAVKDSVADLKSDLKSDIEGESQKRTESYKELRNLIDTNSNDISSIDTRVSAIESTGLRLVTADEIDKLRHLSDDAEDEYATKTELKDTQSTITSDYTQAISDLKSALEKEFQTSIADLSHFSIETVDALPDPVTTPDITTTIYLVPEEGSITDSYVEYVYSTKKGSWERIGTTTTDLSDYYTKNEVDEKLANIQNTLIAGDGISISEEGISVVPATSESIGGVKVGDGLAVTEDGTLSIQPAYSYDLTAEDLKKSDTEVYIEHDLGTRNLFYAIQDSSGYYMDASVQAYSPNITVVKFAEPIAEGDLPVRIILSPGVSDPVTKLSDAWTGLNIDVAEGDESIVTENPDGSCVWTIDLSSHADAILLGRPLIVQTIDSNGEVVEGKITWGEGYKSLAIAFNETISGNVLLI